MSCSHVGAVRFGRPYLVWPSPQDGGRGRRPAQRSEFDRAFVLTEYFGYLRRNPDDAPEPGRNFAGWGFWLDKLEQFNGNYIQAEMVKAFISPTEYRNRFGQLLQRPIEREETYLLMG